MNLGESCLSPKDDIFFTHHYHIYMQNNIRSFFFFFRIDTKSKLALQYSVYFPDSLGVCGMRDVAISNSVMLFFSFHPEGGG